MNEGAFVVDGQRIDVQSIEELMDRAWPAPDHMDAGEWTLRAAAGVTQRANSVWPRRAAADPAAALREAALWYRDRRLPLIFQVFQDDRSETLNGLLDSARFTRQSETLILVRGSEAAPGEVRRGPQQEDPLEVFRLSLLGTEILDTPSEEWLDLWWSVDGRGGKSELHVARNILAGCPAVYALVRDADGIAAAVGRLALVDGWGGLYCMATRQDRRRLGFGSQVLRTLLEEGSRRGVAGFWLLVTGANGGAQALYRQSGFTEAGRYLYRQAPLLRTPSGC